MKIEKFVEFLKDGYPHGCLARIHVDTEGNVTILNAEAVTKAQVDEAYQTNEKPKFQNVKDH